MKPVKKVKKTAVKKTATKKSKADVVLPKALNEEEEKKPELIDDEAPTGIESTIRLEEIKLKDLKWLCKLRIGTTLPRSYHLYKIVMDLDEQPYLDRIEDLEAQLRGTLFEDVKAERKQMDKMIVKVRDELRARRSECEVMKFNCSVEELKYREGDTIMTVRVPDDVIEAFNRQKSQLSYYKIVLESL